jgi:hypothetical protein
MLPPSDQTSPNRMTFLLNKPLKPNPRRFPQLVPHDLSVTRSPMTQALPRPIKRKPCTWPTDDFPLFKGLLNYDLLPL